MVMKSAWSSDVECVVLMVVEVLDVELTVVMATSP
jgi:hypothetical protein